MSECPSCSAPLADEQRYCVVCGRRLGELRLPAGATAGSAGTPAPDRNGRRSFVLRVRDRPFTVTLPGRWSASALAAVVLGCGIFLGAAIGPAVAGQGLASAAGRVVLLGDSGGSGSSDGTASGATASAPELGAPEGNTPAPAPAADSGGGGSSDTGSSSTAPAAAPTETSPAPSEPAPQTETTSPGGGSDTSSTDPKVDGVVVHLVPAAKTYVIATDTGELVPVHADKLQDLGTKVQTVVHQLANGTFGERKITKKGSSKTAKLSGTVTYVDPTARVYSVSVRGASLLVHVPQQQTDPLPQLGELVTVDASLAPRADDPTKTELDQSTVKGTGQASGPVDLVGTVQALDTQQRTITLTADDVRESAHDVVISVPPSIDMTAVKQGDVLDVTATIGTDGSYALTGASHDEDEKAADDSTRAVGDQAPAATTPK